VAKSRRIVVGEVVSKISHFVTANMPNFVQERFPFLHPRELHRNYFMHSFVRYVGLVLIFYYPVPILIYCLSFM
jgi:hypothetical protein